jgi:hypothetical protein
VDRTHARSADTVFASQGRLRLATVINRQYVGLGQFGVVPGFAALPDHPQVRWSIAGSSNVQNELIVSQAKPSTGHKSADFLLAVVN